MTDVVIITVVTTLGTVLVALINRKATRGVWGNRKRKAEDEARKVRDSGEVNKPIIPTPEP